MQTYKDLFHKLLFVFRNTKYVGKNGYLKRQELANQLSRLNYHLINFIMNSSEFHRDNNSLKTISNIVKALRSSIYFNNSKTDYKNTIGLVSKDDNSFIRNNNNVVLDYPYKDTVLVGNEVENQKHVNEYMLNNIIDGSAIKDLFSPKILCESKQFDKNHPNGIPATSFDADRDSLFIEGNNLIALYSLLPKYEGKIKSIIIDPPYYFKEQKPQDAFNYNSNFHLSTWLTFMKNRLDIAIRLLSNNGFLAMTMGSDGSAYLKVLTDEIFDINHHPKRYIGTIAWRKDTSQSNVGDFANVTDNILLYRKNEKTKLLNLPLSEVAKKQYRYNDHNGQGPYTRRNLVDKTRGKYNYTIVHNGHIYKGPWMKSRKQFKSLENNNDILWTPHNGNPYMKTYLKDKINSGQITSDFWGPSLIKNPNKKSKKNYIKINQYGTNNNSRNEIKALFGNGTIFATPKPEELASKLISITSRPDDIVMDFFAGSATTQAVAMKMHRRFIGVEQMKSTCEKIAIPRLLKVFNHKYDKVGVHNTYGRESMFVFAKLMPRNLKLIQKIHKNSDNPKVLDNIYKMILDKDNNVRVDIKALYPKYRHKYRRLVSCNDKVNFLSNMLDKSGLYYNYNDIDDNNIQGQKCLSNNDIQFNNDFYKGDRNGKNY